VKYQDLKIRDAGRLALMGVGLGAAAVLLAAFQDQLPAQLRRHVTAWLWAGAILLPPIWGMAVYYLLSTPEQNARFIEWARRRGVAQTTQAPSPIDPRDPDYRTATLSYLWRRRRKASGG
jgi:hypothetical protein